MTAVITMTEKDMKQAIAHALGVPENRVSLGYTKSDQSPFDGDIYAKVEMEMNIVAGTTPPIPPSGAGNNGEPR